MSEFALRPAGAADHPVLEMLMSEQIVSEQDFDIRKIDVAWVHSENCQSYIKMVCNAPDQGISMIANTGHDDPVGFLCGRFIRLSDIFSVSDTTMFSIDYLFVRPNFRRQGVAAMMLNAIETRMRRQGVTALRVSASVGNSAALKTYQAQAFQAVEMSLEKPLFPPL
ncbi:GNAT family N-acetyltransferase [uncultured Tateyamaria sp.]|uniref:GNAT family N-acetyltransferase n=1 Tax=uncultured Tateyamaria sp. TaxID=455651 RepID=UPI002633BB68|nr:GNAT family N-acetyltransferase [uncultured Tateyamaria sp.]